MILKLKNRKIKSRGLLVSLAFLPVLSLLISVATPMLQPRAYAATGSKSDIADRVFSYQALLMMTSQCVWTPGDGAIRAAEVPGWMATDHNGNNMNERVGSAFQKYIGISDANLALSDCDDPLWINKALTLWGYNSADFLKAIQNAGGFRTDKPNYTTYAVRDHTREWTAIKKVVQNSSFYKGSSASGLSADEKYYDWLTNFTTQCSATFSTSANKNNSEENISAKTQAYVNGTLTDGYWHYNANIIDKVDVGTALTSDGASSCGDMAKAVTNPANLNAFITYIKAGGAAPQSGTGGSGAAGNDNLDVNCGSKVAVILNPLNWLMCPIIESLTGVARGLDSGINSMMTIDVSKTFAKTPKVGNYGAWQQMRIYAIIFLVIATLAIVISQALGFELLDAYTVRKVLPRLLVAAVAISISWELMTFFVGLTNDLGNGIRAIIYAPFTSLLKGNTVNLGGGGMFIADLIGAGAIAALGVMGLLSFVATAALAVAVAFLVLVLRQLLITVLIIVAPVAIVCYILPNTQKIWSLWWDSFSKGLMMFPIIAAFIAVGRVGAATASQTATQGGGALYSFIAFVSYFAPYFLIPLSFKFAGGAIGSIGGAVHNGGRGITGGLKKYRQGQLQTHGGRRVESASRRVLQKRADINDALNTQASSANRSRFSRRAFGILASSTAGYNLEADASRKRALVGKEVNDQIATGVDSEVRGLTVNKKTSRKRNNAGQIEYETLGGAWVSEASVNKGHSRWGNDTYAQQAALSYEMRKATSEDQIRGLGDNYHNVTDGWGMSANQAGGAWIGAAFENQGQHLEYKYTNWKDGTMGASRPGGDVKSDGFVDEIYEKKGSYPLAQMSSFSVERLKDAHVAAEAIGDVDQMNKIKAISETFMSELGGGMYAPPAGGAGPVVQPGARTNRMANTPGAAHVAERARELADMTGAYVAAPTGPHLPPPDHRGTSTPNNMDQH